MEVDDYITNKNETSLALSPKGKKHDSIKCSLCAHVIDALL